MLHALVVLPNIIPSNLIGILTPLRYLEAEGALSFDTCLEASVRPRQIRDADLVITGRNLDPQYRPIYELALDYGVPIISELDDNFLEPSSSLGGYYHDPERMAYLEWLLSCSALVRVYSAYLEKMLLGKHLPVERVTAALDWGAVAPTLPELRRNPLAIVYQTSRTSQDPLFPIVEADLHQILRRYRTHVQLHLYGFQPTSFSGDRQVIFHSYQPTYSRFLYEFTRSGHAIGLAPMIEDSFHQAKTNAKFRDFAAAGVVGLYQDCAVYADVVHGETGLRVDTHPDAWAAGIEWLLSHPAELTRIREHARRYAEIHFSLAGVGKRWLDQITRVVAASERRAGPEQIPSRWWFTNVLLPSKFITPPTNAASLGSPTLEWIQRQYQRLIPDSLRLRFRAVRHRLLALVRRPRR